MAIVNVRGTHGSGKSWLVHQLIAVGGGEPIVDPEVKGRAGVLGYHVPKYDLAAVGTYANVCGGCDAVKTMDEVVRRVRLFAAQYRNVLFEGIIVSHTYTRFSALAHDLRAQGHSVYWAFLNTPAKTCVARVRARRLAKGNRKPLDTKNIINDYNGIWGRCRKKALEDKHDVRVIDWHRPLQALVELLD